MTELEKLTRAYLAADDKTQSLYARLKNGRLAQQDIADRICAIVALEGNHLKRIVCGGSLLTVAPVERVLDRCPVDYVMPG